jgi:folate-binding protein YgfZ
MIGFPENVNTIVMGDVETALDAAFRIVAIRRIRRPVIEVSGPDRADLLHRLCTNAVTTALSGSVVPACFLTHKGRFVDYAVMLVRPDSILLCPSAPSADPLADWIRRFIFLEDVRISVVETSYEGITLFGKESPDVARNLFGSLPAPGTYAEHTGSGWNSFVMTGELPDRIDILTSGDITLRTTFQGLSGIPDLDDATYTVYRTVAGIPAYGHEITDAHHPLEVGLASAVSFTKGCYTGQEVIARMETYRKMKTRLCGVIFDKSTDLTTPVVLHRPSTPEKRGEVTTMAERETFGVRTGLAVAYHRTEGDAEEELTVVTDAGKRGYLYEVPVSMESLESHVQRFLQDAH